MPGNGSGTIPGRGVLVLGIDPSSVKLALVAWTSETPIIAADYYLAKRSGPEACFEALGAMQDFCDSLPDQPKKVAFLELPVQGRGGYRATVVQAYVNGVVQAWLVNEGFDVRHVNVSSWKAEVCGDGRASKEAVGQALAVRWLDAHIVCRDDQDLVDAACICLYGRIIMHRSRKLGNKPQGVAVVG
jgi:hypothetical protein